LEFTDPKWKEPSDSQAFIWNKHLFINKISGVFAGSYLALKIVSYTGFL